MFTYRRGRSVLTQDVVKKKQKTNYPLPVCLSGAWLLGNHRGIVGHSAALSMPQSIEWWWAGWRLTEDPMHKGRRWHTCRNAATGWTIFKPLTGCVSRDMKVNLSRVGPSGFIFQSSAEFFIYILIPLLSAHSILLSVVLIIGMNVRASN